MGIEIDMEKLKTHVTRGLPYLEFMEPDGEVYFGYALKALTDLRTVESKKFNRMEKHASFLVIGLAPVGAAIPRTRKNSDEYVEIGQSYQVNCSRHTVLQRRLQEFDPLEGKILQVMNRGDTVGKENVYKDYVVLLIGGEMTAKQLRLTKFIHDNELQDPKWADDHPEEVEEPTEE